MNVMLLITVVTLGAPALKDPLTKEMNIVGEWIVERSERDGKTLVDESTWVFKAEGTVSFRERGKDVLKNPYLYTIDRDTSPMTIDMIQPNDDDPNRFRGIFKFEGD